MQGWAARMRVLTDYIAGWCSMRQGVFAGLLVAMVMVSDVMAADVVKKSTLVPVSYFLSETIYGDQERPLGKLMVCVQLAGAAGDDGSVDLAVGMPNSGQVLSATAAVKRRNDKVLTFEFADDGWGNAGRGTLTIVGSKADLVLQQTSWPEQADRNISRNYGHFALEKGPCPRQ